MHPQPSPHMPKSKDAQLSRPRGTRSLVAAVCFRILSTEIEFLLVRTRRGRWTFPKGGTEPGLTHAQSAALEALEEAGVHVSILSRRGWKLILKIPYHLFFKEKLLVFRAGLHKG